MSDQLDALLERARDPGNFVERRHFKLSRAKAIEKQREFALQDPKQYVLELIQGAIFAGATYMAVDARPRDILVAWVGAPPLQVGQLENLFDYLFANRTDKRIRHMVQIAVGVNALLQCQPSSIRILSGSGGNAIRMDIQPTTGGELETDIGVTDTEIDGTFIEAKFEGRTWLSRFMSVGRSKWTDIAEIVERRCLYTPVPILLNGTAPFGFRASRNIEVFGATAQETFDHGDRRGVIAIHSSPRAPKGFRIVVGGVWITKHDLPELAKEALVGVICDDGLRKTADHSDIVQDGRYVRMLHAIQPHANTLIKRSVNARYVPPDLPRVPDEEPEEREEAGPAVTYLPLPEILPLQGARGTTHVDALAGAGDEPMFWCTPKVAETLTGEIADPLRFPFRLLILEEGQANTLLRDHEGIQVNRINAPADIDFVLRVFERRVRLRTLTVEIPQGTLTIRLHLEGRLPAWGNGRPGIPVLVRQAGQTRSTGVIDESRVFLHGVPPFELTIPLSLPRISLVIETRTRKDAWVDDAVARATLDAAWQLAAPDVGEPDPVLLAGLLGTQCLPQLAIEAGAPVISAALPPSWPKRLRTLPLVDTHRGSLDLDGFLGLYRSGEVAVVRDPEQLDRMRPLEARFGFGHLATRKPPKHPLFGVALLGGRWTWIQGPEFYSSGLHFSHLIYVAHDLQPRTADDDWESIEQPYPELVAVKLRDADAVDLTEGWLKLFDGLRQIEVDRAWDDHVDDDAPLERVQSMGRLALLHLAQLVEDGLREPLLLPSDGGARWSIERFLREPKARVAAANGVVVAEPHTFMITNDELTAVSQGRPVTLRYDDSPDVWRSLSKTSDEGWLLRVEIQESRLQGWLGLRQPYDPTSGILLRTTGQLIGLPELDERVPCHGLLWPAQGHAFLTPDERQLLQLAGLRMYGTLADMLRSRLDPEQAEAARLYAWTFCFRAHHRGGLSGTSLQLARQVEVFFEDGRTFGTLDRWLVTPDTQRPPPPAGVYLPEPPAETLDAPDEPQDRLRTWEDRLNAALPRPLKVKVIARELNKRDLVRIQSAGDRDHMVVALNQDHAMVQEAITERGRAREMILLEAARQIVLRARTNRHRLDLTKLQQVLLSQRFEA